MPLILGRQAVLDEYARAAEHRWVLPAFNTESQTCLEAILATVKHRADELGRTDLPIIVGITNCYWHRAQTVEYSRAGNWKLGLRLFLDDIAAMCSSDSPYRDLHVMIHIDHAQWDADAELLASDLGRFSSIMYDASTLPMQENLQRTAEFVEKNRDVLVIEGACDEIGEASGDAATALTTPDQAERFMCRTGVDVLVANLGTEHRASNSSLRYHRELARDIKSRIGPRLCLHGTSSVASDQLGSLFSDGICKVNVWTALERDSTPILFDQMLQHAGAMIGGQRVRELVAEGFLGPRAAQEAQADIAYFTTAYRQSVIFRQMQQVVRRFVDQWYQ